MTNSPKCIGSGRWILHGSQRDATSGKFTCPMCHKLVSSTMAGKLAKHTQPKR